MIETVVIIILLLLLLYIIIIVTIQLSHLPSPFGVHGDRVYKRTIQGREEMWLLY